MIIAIFNTTVFSKHIHRTVNLDYEVHCHPDTKEELSPIVISHALYGCKTDWMVIGKELNYVTKRKVCTADSPHKLPDMLKGGNHQLVEKFTSGLTAPDKFQSNPHKHNNILKKRAPLIQRTYF